MKKIIAVFSAICVFGGLIVLQFFFSGGEAGWGVALAVVGVTGLCGVAGTLLVRYLRADRDKG